MTPEEIHLKKNALSISIWYALADPKGIFHPFTKNQSPAAPRRSLRPEDIRIAKRN